MQGTMEFTEKGPHEARAQETACSRRVGPDLRAAGGGPQAGLEGASMGPPWGAPQPLALGRGTSCPFCRKSGSQHGALRGFQSSKITHQGQVGPSARDQSATCFPKPEVTAASKLHCCPDVV